MIGTEQPQAERASSPVYSDHFCRVAKNFETFFNIAGRRRRVKYSRTVERHISRLHVLGSTEACHRCESVLCHSSRFSASNRKSSVSKTATKRRPVFSDACKCSNGSVLRGRVHIVDVVTHQIAQSVCSNLLSAISYQQSAISNLQSAISYQLSAISNHLSGVK